MLNFEIKNLYSRLYIFVQFEIKNSIITAYICWIAKSNIGNEDAMYLRNFKFYVIL
jgi:hypothetical protein